MTASSQALLQTASLLPTEGSRRLLAQTGLVLAGTLVITMAARIQVPMWPVSMSLQTLAILLIAGFGGSRLATLTVLAYLAEGAAGLPVFQGTPERGIGLAYMVGPTGGYLLGFVIMAFLVGRAADKGWSARPVALLGTMIGSEIIMLACGALWIGALLGLPSALAYGIGPFIISDLVKVVLAATLVMTVTRSLPARPGDEQEV